MHLIGFASQIGSAPSNGAKVFNLVVSAHKPHKSRRWRSRESSRNERRLTKLANVSRLGVDALLFLNPKKINIDDRMKSPSSPRNARMLKSKHPVMIIGVLGLCGMFAVANAELSVKVEESKPVG